MRSTFHVMLAMAPLLLAAAPAAHAQAASDPTVYVVRYIEVTPTGKNQGVGLLKQLADASRKDAGTLRFDVLQRTAPANHFVIYEVWKDKEALDAHLAAPHTKQFLEAVQPLLLAPIDDRPCIATDVAPATPASGRARYVITHVDFGPPNREAGINLLKTVAGASRKDSGSLEYDVLQQTARTNHFEVVEVWKDEKSNDAHEMTAGTKEFRAKISPLIGAHYDRRWYKTL
jgi:quinol monooxygenase YgiN